MKQVVLFSPSRFSLYTISIAELLRRQDVCIAGIFVRRLWNAQRFASEFNRDGARLLKKIWKKLILRRHAYAATSFETIADFMRQEGIPFKNIDEFGKQHNVPITYCKELNDAVVVEGLKRIRPDVVVFTGGGLIRADVLQNSGAGVLNCHMGVLPVYRGMDVIEWPILDGHLDQVGMTVHFMDQGVDTGDILSIRKVELSPHENIAQLRDRYEPLMCREMVGSCLGYLNGQLQRKPQRLEDGKQYFIMHSRLIEIAEAKLRRTGSV